MSETNPKDTPFSFQLFRLSSLAFTLVEDNWKANYLNIALNTSRMYYDNRYLNTGLNTECTMTADSENLCLDSLIGFSIR